MTERTFRFTTDLATIDFEISTGDVERSSYGWVTVDDTALTLPTSG